MFRVTGIPKIGLVLAGSMDCLTTIIGIAYFGAVESNPLISDITNTNLIAYVAVKFTTILFAALMFHFADKSLLKIQDKKSKSFKLIRYTVKGAYVATMAFLLVCVVNNLIIVASAI